MIYTGEKITLRTFINESNEKLRTNAIKQAKNNGITDELYDDYIIIKVEGYYNIVLVKDEWYPIEISDIVYPFDEDRIYPMQEIRLQISYEY